MWMTTISIVIMVIIGICISIITTGSLETPPMAAHDAHILSTAYAPEAPVIGGEPRIINALIVSMTLRVRIVYMIRRVRAVFVIMSRRVQVMLMWCVTSIRGMLMISLGLVVPCPMILGRCGSYIVIVIWKIGTDGTKGYIFGTLCSSDCLCR